MSLWVDLASGERGDGERRVGDKPYIVFAARVCISNFPVSELGFQETSTRSAQHRRLNA